MSFRLQATEPAPEGIQRVVYEQIDSAVRELNDRRRNQHKAIHSARQRCKRVRAVVRLAREDLGDHYRAENQRFRDIARKLSDARDAEAVIEAVDKLHTDCEGQREGYVLQLARRILTARHRQVMAAEQGPEACAEHASQALREAKELVATWPLSSPRFNLVGPGIEQTYAAARKAFRSAYRDPSDTRFHETRKRVKYHWYQMRLVQDVWPDMLRAYRRSLKSMSDLLGDDHDLTVMRAILLERPTAFRRPRDLQDMLALIEGRRARLQADAHVLGRRIFAERPGNFRKRLSRYWQAWQEESNSSTNDEQTAGEPEQHAVA